MTDKRWIRTTALIIILALVGYGINYWYRLPKYHDGEMAQPFTATLADGKSFKLHDLKGQYILLDFWGSWCGPCRRESPALVRLYAEFQGQTFKDATGFEIVSIAVETKKDRWMQAIQDDQLSWPYHISELKRFSGDIVTLYGVREIPTKYLIDAEGKIVMVNPSFEELYTYLDKNRIAE